MFLLVGSIVAVMTSFRFLEGLDGRIFDHMAKFVFASLLHNSPSNACQYMLRSYCFKKNIFANFYILQKKIQLYLAVFVDNYDLTFR